VGRWDGIADAVVREDYARGMTSAADRHRRWSLHRAIEWSRNHPQRALAILAVPALAGGSAAATCAEDVGTAVVGLIALLAAITAAYFALPGYVEWTKQQAARPKVSIGFERFDSTSGATQPIEDEEITVESHTLQLRVIVKNEGTATLRFAILNVLVDAECELEVLDHKGKQHYALPWPGRNDEIVPGRTTDVRFTAAERDFPPGNHFLYHIEIKVPRPGDWPVLVALDGSPPPGARGRLVIHSTEQTSLIGRS